MVDCNLGFYNKGALSSLARQVLVTTTKMKFEQRTALYYILLVWSGLVWSVCLSVCLSVSFPSSFEAQSHFVAPVGLELTMYTTFWD